MKQGRNPEASFRKNQLSITETSGSFQNRTPRAGIWSLKLPGVSRIGPRAGIWSLKLPEVSRMQFPGIQNLNLWTTLQAAAECARPPVSPPPPPPPTPRYPFPPLQSIRWMSCFSPEDDARLQKLLPMHFLCMLWLSAQFSLSVLDFVFTCLEWAASSLSSGSGCIFLFI